MGRLDGMRGGIGGEADQDWGGKTGSQETCVTKELCDDAMSMEDTSHVLLDNLTNYEVRPYHDLQNTVSALNDCTNQIIFESKASFRAFIFTPMRVIWRTLYIVSV